MSKQECRNCLPVWLALAGWYVGSVCRVVGPRGEGDATEAVYRHAWLLGAGMIVLHIIASYGITYRWSHAAAVQATADESERVTGIRAGWGVYVNFAFAATWLGYSTAMVLFRRRLPRLDPAVFWFTATIVFSATVVFETGPIRWLAVGGFALLVAVGGYDRVDPRGGSEVRVKQGKDGTDRSRQFR